MAKKTAKDEAGKVNGAANATGSNPKKAAPAKKPTKAKGDPKDATVTGAAVSLEEAKARFDAAKKANADAKAQQRKDKKLIDSAASRNAKLDEQIRKAKANTTKSAEELLKKAEQFEKETAKLAKEGKGIANEAAKVRDGLETKRMELAEIRAANKAQRQAKQGDKPRKANPAAAKIALVKALKKRNYVEIVNNDGQSIGAKDDKGVELAFAEGEFTLVVDGGEPVTMKYGAGAIQKVEAAIEDARKPAEDAGKTESKESKAS